MNRKVLDVAVKAALAGVVVKGVDSLLEMNGYKCIRDVVNPCYVERVCPKCGKETQILIKRADEWLWIHGIYDDMHMSPEDIETLRKGTCCNCQREAAEPLQAAGDDLAGAY